MIQHKIFLTALLLTSLSLSSCSAASPSEQPKPSVNTSTSSQMINPDFEIEKTLSDNRLLFIWHNKPSRYTELGYGTLQLADIDGTICLKDLDYNSNLGLVAPEGSYIKDNNLYLNDNTFWTIGKTLDGDLINITEPIIDENNQNLKPVADLISNKCKRDSIRIMLIEPKK